MTTPPEADHKHLARLLAALSEARHEHRQDEEPDAILVRLFDKVDSIAADRARDAVAASLAGLNAAQAEAAARRARILSAERGTT